MLSRVIAEKWKDLLINLLFNITWVMHCMKALITRSTYLTQANIIKITRKNFICILKKLSQGSFRGKTGVSFFEKQKWNTVSKLIHLDQSVSFKTNLFIKNFFYACKTFFR